MVCRLSIVHINVKSLAMFTTYILFKHNYLQAGKKKLKFMTFGEDEGPFFVLVLPALL